MGVELRELQLTFVDDKSVVQLPVFNDKFATHLCAATLPIPRRPTRQVSAVADPHIAGTSRTIGSGRKTSAACSRACCTMLPTCKIYLDEDGADEDERGRAQVEQASTLLVFLTIEYRLTQGHARAGSNTAAAEATHRGARNGRSVWRAVGQGL